jgi:NifU-like protein involved in Fe-S cluster formation
VQYSPLVARHFTDPANAGAPSDDVTGWVRGAAGDRAQGARVVFHLRIQGGEIAEIRFQAFGCPHTIAACSLATEWLTGRPVDELMELIPAALLAALEAPVEKMGRMLLIQDALREGLAAWENQGLPDRPILYKQ